MVALMKWENVDQIAKQLHIHSLYQEDVTHLKLNDLHDIIINLDDFEDDCDRVNKPLLNIILNRVQEMIYDDEN
jgi:FeS assembly protein IscX